MEKKLIRVTKRVMERKDRVRNTDLRERTKVIRDIIYRRSKQNIGGGHLARRQKITDQRMDANNIYQT